MSTKRYEYDLDHNGQWRWIATADNDEIVVSPQGYAHLQDCLHAIALMQQAGDFALRAGVEEARRTLARLQMHGSS